MAAQAPHVATSPPAAGPGAARPHRITVGEFMHLVDHGFIRGRAELVNGAIFHTAPQGNAHSVAVSNGYDELRRAFPKPWFIRCQATHRFTDHDAPEPDLAVLRHPPVQGALIDELPVLVVEVSDTTLDDDLGRKRSDYAGFGVGEYWVADLTRRHVHVFRGPNRDAATVEDAYREHAIIPFGGTVSPLANPAAVIRVADIVPPAGG